MRNTIEIKFDLREIIAEFSSLNEATINSLASNIVEGVTLEIYRNWNQAAKSVLKSSRFTYLRSLQVVSFGSYKKGIVLNGTLPNMIEGGVGAFDEKMGFMKSAKVKYNKKGGWYLTIPFRFGTPGIVGESEVFNEILPQEIYNILKDMKGEITAPFSATKTSGTALALKDIPTKYQAPRTRYGVGNLASHQVFDNYVNKTSIYAGISKSTGIYEKTSQSSYNSFRRAGKNSDALSWIHSGIKAYNLADRALASTDIRTVTDNITDAILSKI